MYNGRNNGKKLLAVRIVKHTLEIIHLTTDQNPIQVLVNAIMNSGCREDSTRIGSGGVVRRQAVDCSPLRRVNQAIYLLTTGVSWLCDCLRRPLRAVQSIGFVVAGASSLADSDRACPNA